MGGEWYAEGKKCSPCLSSPCFSRLHFLIFILEENNCINFSLANPVYIKGNGKVQKQFLSQLLSTRPSFFVLSSLQDPAK